MEATIGKAINEWKIGVNELYKSDKNTEWLKNNLPTAEQDFKNRLASSGIDNLLKSVQVGNVRQNTQESRQRVQNLKVEILELYNQMKNRNENTEINQQNANTNKQNANTNKLNQMNNVDKLDFEHQKLNVIKSLQEQGLSIQETNMIMNGVMNLAKILK